MTWLFWALVSVLLFTLVNFIDKFLLNKYIRDYSGLPIIGGIVAAVMAVVLWVLADNLSMPFRDGLIVFLIGFFAIWTAILYFKVIDAMPETSTFIVLMQIQPVMILIMSFLFLDERITVAQFIGFVLILMASVGVSMSNADGLRLSPNRPLFMILGLNFIFAVMAVGFKFVSDQNEFLPMLWYQSLGSTAASAVMFLFFPRIRHSFMYIITNTPPKALGLYLINEGFVLGAEVTQLFAITLGPVALVKVVASTQVFMGIAMGWLLSTFLATYYVEDISRGALMRKGAFAGVMFVGVLLIN